jgi:hypothetical protein
MNVATANIPAPIRAVSATSPPAGTTLAVISIAFDSSWRSCQDSSPSIHPCLGEVSLDELSCQQSFE